MVEWQRVQEAANATTADRPALAAAEARRAPHDGRDSRVFGDGAWEVRALFLSGEHVAGASDDISMSRVESAGRERFVRQHQESHSTGQDDGAVCGLFILFCAAS